MRRTLRYADAVALLGGESAAVAALDRVLGGALLMATGGGAATTAALLGARGDVVRVGNELIGRMRDGVRGYSRYDQTQRLEAAHTVLVVTAFFEALNELDLPIPLDRVGFSASDQLRLAGHQEHDRDVVSTLFNAPSAMPRPHLGEDEQREELRSWYEGSARRLADFLTGMDLWDGLDDTRRGRLTTALREVLPDAAIVRYTISYRRLAVDLPEFGWWTNQQGHLATHRALADLEQLLREISAGAAPDQRQVGLARSHRAALDRPIIAESDLPAGVVVPTLQACYIDPNFRIRAAPDRRSAADETSWAAALPRNNLAVFLAGHLTAPAATETPLLVLGQPGAGKSVLTRILAARLPAEDFLPVRVELREVPADADVQDQIEYAVRATTGETTNWPDVVRSAGRALPVVLLDGFDELLQATGANHSDYLQRVAKFQQREADQQRPVAVVVTSRTAVADRAYIPPGTVVLRLDPFTADQIEQWLAVWNTVNVDEFARRRVAPLAADTALRHRALAEQPLLLLMLALYDSDANALAARGDDLDEAELYEQLLRTFAEREIGKTAANRQWPVHGQLVDDELLRLSLVAFAMFNRGRQWVTDAELDADLDALLSGPVREASLRADFRSGEAVLGRFFFIQRAQAVRDGAELATYEFLHATFGEYLVARLVHLVAAGLAAQEQAARAVPLGAGGCQDGLLHALLSFGPLTARGPVLEFLRAMATRSADANRTAVGDLAVVLFQRLDSRTDDARYAGYRPRQWPAPGRYGRYGLNLVLLAATYHGQASASKLFRDAADPVDAWRTHALLWQSTLSIGEWNVLLDVVQAQHSWRDDRRDLTITVDPRRASQPTAPIDLYWLDNIEDLSQVTTSNLVSWYSPARHITRQAALTADPVGGRAAHLLEPLIDTLAGITTTFVGFPPWQRREAPDPPARSKLNAILALHAAGAAGQHRPDVATLYHYVVDPLSKWPDMLNRELWTTGLTMVLNTLVSDAVDLSTDELLAIIGPIGSWTDEVCHSEQIIDAVLNHLAVNEPSAEQLAMLNQTVVLGSPARVYLRWTVGLLELGRGHEIDPPKARLAADVGGHDSRILARARALFRLHLGIDLDRNDGTPLPDDPNPQSGMPGGHDRQHR